MLDEVGDKYVLLLDTGKGMSDLERGRKLECGETQNVC